MPETLLSVSDTAALLEIGERAVRKNALSGRYGTLRYIDSESGCGKNGKAIRISLDALPAEYQLKYVEENGLGAVAEKAAPADYETAPAWARQRAGQSYMILTAYESYMAAPDAGTKTERSSRFIAGWNLAHPDDTVSRSTLLRWQAGYRREGMTALLPRYGQTKGQHFTLSTELLNEFICCLGQKASLAQCHYYLQMLAAEKGLTCPSYDTLRRVALEIPKAVLVAIQDGKKTFYNKVQTYTRRDPESIRAGQVFVGDHRKFDFFILGPRGTWVRPWVTAWLDMRSGKLVSWLVTFSPNTDTIMSTFAEAALDPAIGLPREIYIDNGRDYCNERFAGHGFREKLKTTLESEKQRVVPMLEHLGIIAHFAIPENARAKTIERVAFGNMSKWFDPWFATYCGRNAAEKPETLNDKLKGDANKIKYNVTLEQLTEMFDGYARHIYNKRVSERGRGREGECPDETFIRTRLPVRQTTAAVLQHFLQKQTGRYRVGRGGITFRGREYYSPDMILHKGKDVIVSCRASEPDKIYVFDLDERPLFTASPLELVDAMHATPEEMHAEGSRKSAEWKTVKAHPVFQAAQNGEAPNMSQIVALSKIYGHQSPDPRPTTVTEMVPAPIALRDALRYNNQQLATGTDGMSVFELMAGAKIERRKGE